MWFCVYMWTLDKCRSKTLHQWMGKCVCSHGSPWYSIASWWHTHTDIWCAFPLLLLLIRHHTSEWLKTSEIDLQLNNRRFYITFYSFSCDVVRLSHSCCCRCKALLWYVPPAYTLLQINHTHTRVRQHFNHNNKRLRKDKRMLTQPPESNRSKLSLGPDISGHCPPEVWSMSWSVRTLWLLLLFFFFLSLFKTAGHCCSDL